VQNGFRNEYVEFVRPVATTKRRLKPVFYSPFLILYDGFREVFSEKVVFRRRFVYAQRPLFYGSFRARELSTPSRLVVVAKRSKWSEIREKARRRVEKNANGTFRLKFDILCMNGWVGELRDWTALSPDRRLPRCPKRISQSESARALYLCYKIIIRASY